MAYRQEVGEMNSTFMNIPEPTTGMMAGSIIGAACLLILAVTLGILAKRKWTSYDEYLVGKRDIGPWVTGLALAGSFISGWAFCGSVAVVYKVGFSGMWFAGIWCLVGIIPTVWLAATKTREFSQKLGAVTITETIGRRFESKALQTIVAVSMLFFLFIYSVGQLKAAGGVWYAVTGLPPFWCLLISIAIAWLFLALGGYTGKSMVYRGKRGFSGIRGPSDWRMGTCLRRWIQCDLNQPHGSKARLHGAYQSQSAADRRDGTFLHHGGHTCNTGHLLYHGYRISPQRQPFSWHEEIDEKGFYKTLFCGLACYRDPPDARLLEQRPCDSE